MIWLSNYFKKVFCKHEFHFDEFKINMKDWDGCVTSVETRVYMRCDKCGYYGSHLILILGGN